MIIKLRKEGYTINQISGITGYSISKVCAVLYEQNNRDKGYKNPIKSIGIVFRWGSLWVGAHWSSYNRRLCINIIPCVTLKIELY